MNGTEPRGADPEIEPKVNIGLNKRPFNYKNNSFGRNLPNKTTDKPFRLITLLCRQEYPYPRNKAGEDPRFLNCNLLHLDPTSIYIRLYDTNLDPWPLRSCCDWQGSSGLL